MSHPAPGTIEIFVFRGGEYLGSRRFDDRVITIGRAPSAALRIQHPSVTKRHAVLRWEGDSLILSDNSSLSGVYINGKRIRVSKIASSSDEVAIGPFHFKVSRVGQEGKGEGAAPHTASRESAPLPRAAASPNARKGSGGRASPRYPRPPLPPPARIPQPGRARTAPALEEAITIVQPLSGGDRYQEVRGAVQPPSTTPERIEEAPPPAAWEQELVEEDEEDEFFIEPFSLLENIVSEKFKAPDVLEPSPAVEVIHHKENEILDLLRADPGRCIHVGFDDFRLLDLSPQGEAHIYLRQGFRGSLVIKGKSWPIKAFCNEKYAADRHGDLFVAPLKEGDYAQVIVGHSGYLIRFIRAPVQPRPKLRLRLRWSDIPIFGGSAAFHLVVLAFLSVLAPETDLMVDTGAGADAERFAKIAIKDLSLEQQKDEPKPEPIKEVPQPEVSRDLPRPTRPNKPKKISKRAPRRRPLQRPAEQRKQLQAKQVDNILSTLANIQPKGAQPGRSDLQVLARNIAALPVPGGTTSNFKVAGVIKKIPGGGVRLAGLGAGGGRDTRGGRQLLTGRGEKIGKITALARTGTRVRAHVRRARKRAIRTTGGRLDRAAIQNVVNQQIHEIQRCYEVQLLTNPGLAGKIVFDWVISTSGAVSSARQVSSSLRSPTVASCILAKIRRWRFPKPVGGAVQVRYPFIFRIQGF